MPLKDLGEVAMPDEVAIVVQVVFDLLARLLMTRGARLRLHRYLLFGRNIIQ